MIQPAPYEPSAAMQVFRSLDANDLIEAQMVRGRAPVSHLTLFADWHAVQGAAVLSVVIRDTLQDGRDRPFAVLTLGHTGQAGVAQAAMLARDHARFRRQLVAAARAIRDELPNMAAATGIHRIEARSWAGHPTANTFLRACGFAHETPMPGFGEDGRAVFNLFAWTQPTPPAPEEI